MAELRYNPISKDWVMVASHRQARPQMPKGWCPFCPGSGRVPDEGFTVLRYPNDFPALSQSPPTPDDVSGKLFDTMPAYGRCDVLLYSDKHTDTLAGLDTGHIHALSEMWRDCYIDMAKDKDIKYVYLFENRGDVVGVTMPHPHGQAYGYSFIPKKVEEELIGSGEYYSKNGRCLFCDLLEEEKLDGRRILFQNEYFTAYVPFFSPITYGAAITANRHVPNVALMGNDELHALGEIVQSCAGMYDSLFDMQFPYMMCMYNSPTDGKSDEFYHFHVMFYPPMRGETSQQFFASSETGAGAWCNPNCPEEKAKELKAAYEKYKGLNY
jgi:UDPglucose--hexose-1-phosphate uridylyltransferase